jgi:hypothetical protein
VYGLLWSGSEALRKFCPKEEAHLKAMAAELGQTRLLMGLNYQSDVEVGSALGQRVAQKALARAATDGSDANWTGTVPKAVRFLYLGEEARLSHAFGGIHYPSDDRTGSAMGKKLGALALQRRQLNGP